MNLNQRKQNPKYFMNNIGIKKAKENKLNISIFFTKNPNVPFFFYTVLLIIQDLPHFQALLQDFSL
ncbi:MAG: hypothetical protein Lokiarch_16500 [Candidatus Lokiarchaeum sp. GC14_75]|nr:MAG: hypothetical protein Lokiarch_16500 [Candidatus Lokiarchaeum sp. GC14_75]